MSSGYSGTPLAKKLGIKDGARVVLSAAPDRFEENLEALPATATVQRRLGRPADVIVAFATKRSDLMRRLPCLSKGLAPAGRLWIAWPKKSAGVASDISENLLRDDILPTGLVDIKVCAIDETWSGLCFVRRLKNR